MHTILNGVTADVKDDLTKLNKNKHTSSAQLLAEYKHVSRLNDANNTFLYLTMWVVKFAFLAFYYHLFSANRTFVKAWWAVAIFTFITWWVPFAGVLATCGYARSLAQYKQCNSANHARTVKLAYTCALNTATELIIMALPLWQLRTLKIDLKRKIGLAFIFCLALFCVVLDILRTAEAVASRQALYTVLEVNMTVIISCLPIYSTLFSLQQKLIDSRRSRKYAYSGSGDNSGPRTFGSSGRKGSGPLDKAEFDDRERHSLKRSVWSTAAAAPATEERLWDGSEVELDTIHPTDQHQSRPFRGGTELGSIHPAEPVDMTNFDRMAWQHGNAAAPQG